MRRNLRTGFVLIVASVGGYGQTLPNVKQEAKDSNCSNIVALAGNVGVNCSSLSPAQRKILEGIPSVLNKILANQLNTDAVLTKLDEILHALNPNLPVRSYFCNGQWKTTGPSATAAFAITMGGDDTAFQELVRLANSNQNGELLRACQTQIKSAPEWLTPLLFCGLAYARAGDTANAKEMMARFEARTGPAYDTGACKQVYDWLKAGLQ